MYTGHDQGGFRLRWGRSWRAGRRAALTQRAGWPHTPLQFLVGMEAIIMEDFDEEEQEENDDDDNELQVGAATGLTAWPKGRGGKPQMRTHSRAAARRRGWSA
jgi:hypothetical protein